MWHQSSMLLVDLAMTCYLIIQMIIFLGGLVLSAFVMMSVCRI